MENTEEIYTDFARVYDELMDNTPYEMWCNRLDQLIASYGVSRPTRDAEGILDSERNLVVDLGCGTGTLTELLYQKGYDCIGVDNSEEMLGIAMEKKAQRTQAQRSLSASCAPHYLLLSFYCRSYYFSPTIFFLTFRNQTADNTPDSGNRSMLPHIPSPS